MKFYVKPQIDFADNFFGVLFTIYWGDNEVAKYVSINFAFVNITLNLAIGFKK